MVIAWHLCMHLACVRRALMGLSWLLAAVQDALRAREEPTMQRLVGLRASRVPEPLEQWWFCELGYELVADGHLYLNSVAVLACICPSKRASFRWW
mmetsp:Transcript_8994/g.24532  ORF Transcript_8994/g.24532 Transcript_8994/m.24532 type:complete len:96 (+) Transcript_8994:933-1220(+)